MLSQTAEYALRAVVCLAQHPDQPLTTQTIAAKTKVPPGYLSKVMQSLGRAGIVASHRGIYGGFTLLQAPESLSLLDVLQKVDPLPRIKTCPLGLRNHGPHLCPLHLRIDQAAALIEKAFAETSLADLLRTATHSSPLCDDAVAPTS